MPVVTNLLCSEYGGTAFVLFFVYTAVKFTVAPLCGYPKRSTLATNLSFALLAGFVEFITESETL